MKNERLGKKKFNYKWVIVGLCFLMVCISLGFCSSPNSLFLNAITKYLEVERSVFSLNQSIRFITTAIANLFFGTLVLRFGPKKLIVGGMCCLIVAMVVYALAESVYVYYIGGMFLGLGFSFTGTTMVGYVVNIWCKENKGTIMGAILASNGLGGAIAMQIVSPIIESAAAGYKNAYFLVAVILVVVAVLLLIFFKNQPKDFDQSQNVVTKKKSRAQSWVGIELKSLTKKWWFYVFFVCVFFTGFVLQGVGGISAAHMKDVGIDPAFVATVLSVHSISLAGFKFLTGFVYDKRGLRFTATLCSVTAIVVMVLLALVSNTTTGMVLAMTYGIFSSLALPLETIMLPIYAGDLFGQKSYAKILGIVVAVNVSGYATAAPTVNLCFDLTGSYNLALYICAAIMFAVIIGLQFVISAATKEKNNILKEQEELLNKEQVAQIETADNLKANA